MRIPNCSAYHGASLFKQSGPVTAGNQGKIFISYRRQETAWPARQLYEVLVGRFGAESVFKDVDDIEPGDDFVDKITGAVAACDVLLALIGPQWLTLGDDRGNRRLDNPDDFVRLEIRAALTRGVRVVPILVDGAKMPSADQLPQDLVALIRRQAVEINPVGFDTDRLLTTLAATFAAPRPAAPAEPLSSGQAAPAVPPLEDAASQAFPGSGTTPDESPGFAHQPAAVPVEPPVSPEQPPAVPDQLVPDQPPSVSNAVPAVRDETPSFSNAGPAVPDETPSFSNAVPAVFDEPPIVAAPRPVPSNETPAPPALTTGRPVSRRTLAIAAGALVVALVGVLLVLKPWGGTTPTAADVPTPTGPVSPIASGSAPAVGSGPLILAHRGGLEVHQFETEQAMEAAAAAGFSVETDVRYTSDGIAVLVHDENATKGLDCGGRSITVSQTTWADLNKYCKSKPTAKDPAQYPVPRLANTLEGIAAASDQAMVFLEVKTQQSATQRRTFLSAPEEFGLRDRTVVTSFRRDWLEAIAKADPGTKRMLFVSNKQVPVAELGDLKLWAVGVEQGVATKQYVADLKAAGIRVMIWILNDPNQWTTFVTDNPDIMMTDYPARLKDWLAHR